MDYRKLTLQTLPTGIQIPLAAYIKNLKDVGENLISLQSKSQNMYNKVNDNYQYEAMLCLKSKCNLLF